MPLKRKRPLWADDDFEIVDWDDEERVEPGMPMTPTMGATAPTVPSGPIGVPLCRPLPLSCQPGPGPCRPSPLLVCRPTCAPTLCPPCPPRVICRPQCPPACRPQGCGPTCVPNYGSVICVPCPPPVCPPRPSCGPAGTPGPKTGVCPPLVAFLACPPRILFPSGGIIK
jgi:hypothetical protein